jgi:aminoglycoside phosphotransferase (APT) family kinase protein
MSLMYGYTNETTAFGDMVIKRYDGPDATARLKREVAILQSLPEYLPLPEILTYDTFENELRMRRIEGRHGQALLDAGYAMQVLYLCGELLRQLQNVPVKTVADIDLDPRAVIVHGDFGPQNIIVAPRRWEPVALLDWEWTHLGDPVEDLAWAEWIIMTHYAEARDALGELFRGYGTTPPWSMRHSAMITTCERHLRFAEQHKKEEAVALWRQRLQDTANLSE